MSAPAFDIVLVMLGGAALARSALGGLPGSCDGVIEERRKSAEVGDDDSPHRVLRFTRGDDGLLGGTAVRSAYELSTFM